MEFAKFWREMISERTKDKMLARAQKGLWNGGIPSYGYTCQGTGDLGGRGAGGPLDVRSVHRQPIPGPSGGHDQPAVSDPKGEVLGQDDGGDDSEQSHLCRHGVLQWAALRWHP